MRFWRIWRKLKAAKSCVCNNVGWCESQPLRHHKINNLTGIASDRVQSVRTYSALRTRSLVNTIYSVPESVAKRIHTRLLNSH